MKKYSYITIKMFISKIIFEMFIIFEFSIKV